jgi:hypothetical protein
VQWRTVLESTDGPIEHARVRCAAGHHFLLPVADLAVPGSDTTRRHTTVIPIPS